MREPAEAASRHAPVDIGEYCRSVEDHLTRANAGHLVRIVGPGFELVREWAESGVPLSVVYRGIDLKVERHREGAAKRPLRIEFCAGDIRSVFDHWRRAVGVMTIGADPQGLHDGEVQADEQGDDKAAGPRRRSLRRHLDRAIDRLSRAAGQADMPEGLRVECARLLQELATLRETTARARGAARDEATATLATLDAELAAAARRHAPSGWITSLGADAEADLAPFRARLPADAWERSIAVTIDRLLRDRFGLPTLDL